LLRRKNVKKVHLIAACGVGMGSLAGMLKEAGYEVTGSDGDVYPPMSDQLERIGIRLMTPYRPENVPADADFVVIGNTVPRTNVESAEAERRGLPLHSMPSALEELFLADREVLVVAGTHGKTTTTSMAAHALFDLSDDPSFLVGGVPGNFPVSYRLGKGRRFVIEGDEYDTAWFDKGPKFLHYNPKQVILTSVEFDHADIYRDLDHMKESFRKLVEIVPAEGLLVACADYPAAVEVAAGAKCPVVFYGRGERPPSLPAAAPYRRVEVLPPEGTMTPFRIAGEGTEGDEEYRLPVPGGHNAENGAAVALVLRALGFPAERIAAAFGRFRGVARRQEELGEFHGVLVVDDFAHHPTAVRETIDAVRGRWPGRRVVAVFEPRSNTSRRKVFQEEFAQALSRADEVVIAPVFAPEKVPAGELLDPEEVARRVRERGKESHHLRSVEEIVGYLSGSTGKGDLVLLMSNGGFGGMRTRLPAALGERKG
jgi:UDP-N-acetylmuramate: L-alanyl-gamma-D-glutamyl-meso-diaminopimelate ligase